MTVKEAQELVDRWITGTGGGYHDVLTNMAILTEEVGEVASVVARRYGAQRAKPGDLREGDLADELADVLWVTLCLANQTGIDLDAALRANLEKKARRDATRFRVEGAASISSIFS